jgi:hypothetical protein
VHLMWSEDPGPSGARPVEAAFHAVFALWRGMSREEEAPCACDFVERVLRLRGLTLPVLVRCLELCCSTTVPTSTALCATR